MSIRLNSNKNVKKGESETMQLHSNTLKSLLPHASTPTHSRRKRERYRSMYRPDSKRASNRTLRFCFAANKSYCPTTARSLEWACLSLSARSGKPFTVDMAASSRVCSSPILEVNSPMAVAWSWAAICAASIFACAISLSLVKRLISFAIASAFSLSSAKASSNAGSLLRPPASRARCVSASSCSRSAMRCRSDALNSSLEAFRAASYSAMLPRNRKRARAVQGRKEQVI